MVEIVYDDVSLFYQNFLFLNSNAYLIATFSCYGDDGYDDGDDDEIDEVFMRLQFYFTRNIS